MKLAGCALIVAAAACAGVGVMAESPATVDTAFAQFWAARSPSDAAAAADAVVKSGVDFDAALERLRRGRTFAPDVPRGVVRLKHHVGPYDFQYLVEVPETYDPSRKYQVRVQLHGGVSREDASPRGNGIGSLAGAEQIYVMPTAWADAPWWNDVQVQNLRAILDTLKRTYNVDENRVALAGVSDGGTGSYYFAMRDTTPYASFLPLNGDVMVLSNRSNGIQGDLHPNNLLDKPFFAVNGGMDPLYPAWLVEPYTFHFKRHGVEIAYTVEPDAGHNTAWWPEVKGSFETFVREHPRHPHPDTLTWDTDASALTKRAHWLVVDELADRPKAPLPDLNDFAPAPLSSFGATVAGSRIVSVIPGSSAETFGFRSLDIVTGVNGQVMPGGRDVLEVLAAFTPTTPLLVTLTRDGKPIELRGTIDTSSPKTMPLFSFQYASGRVDLVRKGNTVEATTRGVGVFTLLLSPDAFDLSKPVKVVADGKTVFDGLVKRSLETLMTWAARDNDRTMLYGAELHIKLP